MHSLLIHTPGPVFAAYQTVFIKVVQTITTDVTLADDELDLTKNSNYVKLNETVCSEVGQPFP